MLMPTFKKPWRDWESFGRATRFPTEATRPEVGDDIIIDVPNDDATIQVKVEAVDAENVRAQVGPATLIVRVDALRIGYDRMGGYRWEA